MSRSASHRLKEEDCTECGHPWNEHIAGEGKLLCPEFILDLDALRIDAEQSRERYETALRQSHEPR